MLGIITTILKYMNFIPGVITMLQSWGINTGSIGKEALTIVDNTDADIANYDSGQAVVVATLPANAVPGATAAGVLVAMQEGGPAYQALFG